MASTSRLASRWPRRPAATTLRLWRGRFFRANAKTFLRGSRQPGSLALLGDLDRVDSEKFTECNVKIMFRNIRVRANVGDLLAEMCIDVSYETPVLVEPIWRQRGPDGTLQGKPLSALGGRLAGARFGARV